jgi:homoserine acetyltransferase
MTDEQAVRAAAIKLDELWTSGEYKVMLTESCGLTAMEQLAVLGYRYVNGEWVK